MRLFIGKSHSENPRDFCKKSFPQQKLIQMTDSTRRVIVDA